MAELLIMAKNNWMIDANQANWTQEQKDEANRQYQIGDIVQVFPDGTTKDGQAWGDPTFYLLKVSGLAYNDALKYQQGLYEQVPCIKNENTYYTNGKMIKKRKYRIRFELLPAAIRNNISKNKIYSTTFTSIRTSLLDKLTGLTE
mgnify:CR=1 FL=1